MSQHNSHNSYKDRDSSKKKASSSKPTTQKTWQEGRVLGTGVYAKVYVGRHKTLDEVAVKEFFKSVQEGNDNISGSALLKREVAILSKLEHPNIVQYLGCEHRPKPVIFSELLWGNLEDAYEANHIQKGHGPTVKKFLLHVLRGLKYLESKKIVHRDIKPENILVDIDPKKITAENCLESFKIADFGNSVADGSEKKIVGSKHYIPPELFRRHIATTKGDVWSAFSAAVWLWDRDGLAKRAYRHEVFSALYRIAIRPAQLPDLGLGEYDQVLRNCLSQMGRLSTDARPNAAECLHILSTGGKRLCTGCARPRVEKESFTNKIFLSTTLNLRQIISNS